MNALHLSILPPPLRLLWDELSSVPSEFVLYGGTAIALQLGHRQSVDFDFFARTTIDPQRLLETIDFLHDCEPLQLEANTLTVRVQRDGPVLLSYFGVPRLPAIRAPQQLERPRIAVGDLLELAGMKALVIQKRAEAKDYLDIHALLTMARIPLSHMLAAGRALYGSLFTPEITLKSLSFYGDGDVHSVPQAIRSDLARAVRACDPLKLPAL